MMQFTIYRAELDFSSLLTDDQYISISDALFMRVLHAHTRITSIWNFCIPRSFNAFSDFAHYLNLYWGLTFIILSDADPTIPNNDSIAGTYVGHPQGQLQSIYYLGYFGAPSLQEGHQMEQIMGSFDDSYAMQIVSEDEHCIPPLHNSLNWSTVDIDVPYHLCSMCELSVVQDTQICSTCTYVRSFLDDDNDNIDNSNL